MFKNLKKKSAVQKHLKTNTFYSEFVSSALEKNFNFVVLSMPDEYLNNLVFLEDSIDEFDLSFFEVINFHKKDNAYSIKKKIAIYLFKKGRLDKFEEVARSLLANDKIKLSFLEGSYNTHNPIQVFEELTTDIFAFFNSYAELNEDEIAETINSIYVKNHVKNNFSKQSSIDSLFD